MLISIRFSFRIVQTKKSNTYYPKHNHNPSSTKSTTSSVCPKKKSVIKERCTHLMHGMVNLTTPNQQSPPYRLTTNQRKRGICCSVQHVNSPNFGTGEVDEARRGVRISQEHTQCSLLHSRRDSTIAYTECSTQLHEQDEESQNL